VIADRSPIMSKKMQLTDFEMVRTIGTGSFGRVKFARYKPDGIHYAVKFMKKHEIIKLKQVDHINTERSIMMQLSHPFIVNMKGSFKDDRFIYIVMECISGGELFTHLRKARKFTDEQSKFYCAQIALVFDYIHSKNIVHRDLKPENILIARDGYAKLTDFGFAKVIEPGARTFTLCGTPEYIAPEVLLNKGHGKPVDWWTLGILTYECICGQPPFCDEEPMGIYQKILAGKIYFPKYFDKNAKTLVKGLLQADLSKRLGNLKDGSDDILKSKWLADLDMTKILDKSIPAPFKPTMKDDKDVSNFDDIQDSGEVPPPVPASNDPFQDW
jgi:serine/threonine protein kinase